MNGGREGEKSAENDGGKKARMQREKSLSGEERREGWSIV